MGWMSAIIIIVIVHDGGCDVCGGLHSMAHGYAAVRPRVRTANRMLYIVPDTGGAIPFLRPLVFRTNCDSPLFLNKVTFSRVVLWEQFLPSTP
jgi:hypothetical protein